MTRDAENFFIFILDIWTSSFEKTLFSSFAHFFIHHKGRKATLKVIWKHKKTTNSQFAIPSKNSSAEGITIPEFKLYYRAIVIKIAWC
jgi:hypothetical protein